MPILYSGLMEQSEQMYTQLKRPNSILCTFQFSFITFYSHNGAVITLPT